MTRSEAKAVASKVRAAGYQAEVVPTSEDGERTPYAYIVRVNDASQAGFRSWVTDLYEQGDVDSFMLAYAANT